MWCQELSAHSSAIWPTPPPCSHLLPLYHVNRKPGQHDWQTLPCSLVLASGQTNTKFQKDEENRALKTACTKLKAGFHPHRSHGWKWPRRISVGYRLEVSGGSSSHGCRGTSAAKIASLKKHKKTMSCTEAIPCKCSSSHLQPKDMVQYASFVDTEILHVSAVVWCMLWAYIPTTHIWVVEIRDASPSWVRKWVGHLMNSILEKETQLLLLGDKYGHKGTEFKGLLHINIKNPNWTHLQTPSVRLFMWEVFTTWYLVWTEVDRIRYERLIETSSTWVKIWS